MDYPDTRDAFYQLIDGTQVGEGILLAYFRLEPDPDDGGLGSILPAAQITLDGGNQGSFERIDRITVDIYAKAGTAAGEIANQICSLLANKPHYVEGVGLLDNVEVSVVPHDVPYADATIGVNTTEFRVTTRPA